MFWDVVIDRKIPILERPIFKVKFSKWILFDETKINLNETNLI